MSVGRALLLTAAFLGACETARENEATSPFGLTAGWHLVYEGESGALVSARGTLEGVTAVGGPLGNAPGALSVRSNAEGGGWEATVDAAAPGSTWWAWGGGGDTEAVAVGEGGLVTDLETALTPATLYGVWGATADDVWAVGGTPSGEGPDDVVLRRRDGQWSAVDVPEPKGGALFKVWGGGADDVWMCGQGGHVLHWDGAAYTWLRADPPVPLFTVAGHTDGTVYFVGGPPARLFVLDRAAARLDEVPLPGEASILNGVSVAPNGDLWVVGMGGVKWQRKAADGAWIDHSREAPRVDLHAVLALDGAAVVVGGDFISPPSPGRGRRGVVGVFVE